MLSLTYNISPNIEKSLKNIEILRRKILITPLSPELELRYRWETTVAQVYWSLNLVGNDLTRSQMAELLAKSVPNLLYPTETQVVRYKIALDIIKQDWQVTGKSITSKTILKLYQIFTGQKQATSKKVFGKNEKDINHVLTYLQTGSENPVIQAGVAAVQLSSMIITPDNKGRAERLLTQLVLAKYGYNFRGMLVPEEYWRRDKISYSEAEITALNSQNLTLWLEYFTKGIEAQAEKTWNKIESLEVDRTISPAIWALSERQKKILSRMEFPTATITNRDVQKLYKVSQITASRDLSKLTTLGLLFSRGKGRSTIYSRV